MACQDCPARVPIVSQALAAKLAVRLPPECRARTAVACLEWLTRQDHGLSLYEGINGRAYSSLEKDLIALEVPIVATLPCPFAAPTEPEGCILGGIGSLDPGAAPFGWLPTMLLWLIDPVSFRAQITSHSIADAKVSMLTRKTLLDPYEGSQRLPVMA